MSSRILGQSQKVLQSTIFRSILIGLVLMLSIDAGSMFALSKNGPRSPALKHHVIPQISHIVFILKENHTFDSYFGLFPGVNGTTTGKVKVNGVQKTIPLGPFQDKPPDYYHFWNYAHTAYDSGAMDQFNQDNCTQSPYTCYQTAQQTDIPNYWALAQNFVLGDNTFSSLMGPSYPNHMYSIAGASGSDVQQSVIDGPFHDQGRWGCDSFPGTQVKLYNGQFVFPCFNFQTLVDQMNAAAVPWKYYAPQLGEEGYDWNTLTYFSQDSGSPNDVPWQNFVTDAQNNALPAVSWLIPPGTYSDHPRHGQHSMCVGENWAVQQINAVEQSPAWSSTVIVMAWDDYGGYYDHVAPQKLDTFGYGFRVPMLVISPFAHVDDNPSNPHVTHDRFELSSVLRLAEQTFNLPSLGTRDTNAGDLLQTLDFSQIWNQPAILQQRTCPKVSPPKYNVDLQDKGD